MRSWFFALALVPLCLISFETRIEAKASYFYPTDATTREIMGAGALAGIESSFQAYKGLYPWLSVSVFPKGGHSIGERFDTSIRWVPIGLGLKYLFKRGWLSPYAGAGMLPSYLYTKDEAPGVKVVRNKWGFGGIFKAGFYIDIDSFFIDLFADYSILKIGFSDTNKTYGRTADLSGFSGGGGLGIRF